MRLIELIRRLVPAARPPERRRNERQPADGYVVLVCLKTGKVAGAQLVDATPFGYRIHHQESLRVGQHLKLVAIDWVAHVSVVWCCVAGGKSEAGLAVMEHNSLD